MSETEKQKNNSTVPGKNGGARPGAGRPKGSENQSTKDKRIVQEKLKQRVLKSADSLMTSQMNLAKGIQMLYKIKTNKDGSKRKPELVDNLEEIESYLAGEYEDSNDEYYFITTERPDNRALDSLFDRTFGKARQNIGLDGGEDGKPIKTIDVTFKDFKDEPESK